MNIMQWLENLCQHNQYTYKDISRSRLICRGNAITIVYMIFYGIISFLIGFHHGVWIQIWLVCLFAFAFILLKQRVALDLVGADMLGGPSLDQLSAYRFSTLYPSAMGYWLAYFYTGFYINL